MKMNRWGIACVLAAYAFVLGAAIPFFHAAAAPGKAVIQLEELEWDWVPLPAAQHRKTGPVPQAVDKIDKSISKDSIGYVTYFINFAPRPSSPVIAPIRRRPPAWILALFLPTENFTISM